MKSYIFSPRIALTFLLLCALLVNVAATSVSAQTSAESDQNDQTLEALNLSLAQLGESIRLSDDISDAERVSLYISLIEVSRAILTLQPARTVRMIEAEAELDQGTVDPKDIDLYKVVVQFDAETYEAEATLFYSEDAESAKNGDVYIEYTTEVNEYSLALPADGVGSVSFTQRVDDARSQIIDILVDEYDLQRVKLLDDMVFVSSRNPRRDVGPSIATNSAEGNRLLDDFGKYSVAQSVEVRPGVGQASIIITSDQDEKLIVRIARDMPPVPGGRGGGAYIAQQDPEDMEYIFSYDFYSVTVADSVTRERGEEPVIHPKVTSTQDEISRERITEVLLRFFGGVPFAAEIDDIEEKALQFLTENNAQFVVTEDVGATRTTYPEAHADQCIARGDVLFMNEMILQMLDGLETQYIPQESLIKYLFRFETVRRTQNPACERVNNFF
jgi:hypothetical protein